jgi:NAD(P)-dependent dehydrogenase (short-subunit alcohol dehydrogenase family)
MPAAVVTGSSRGIGRAVAVRFARDGYDVAINYRTNERAAEETAAEIAAETDRETVVVRADVADVADAERLVDRAVDAFGGVDHVVNNAGIEESCPTEELSTADFDRLVDVNVNSAYAVTRAALPALRRATDPSGPSIVNVASRIAFTGAAEEAHYVASKAGVVGLTRSHALEFAPDVRVNAVAPGKIDTDMNAHHSPADRRHKSRSIPLGRYGTAAEVADAVAYLRDATYVTGETVHVNGGETMR